MTTVHVIGSINIDQDCLIGKHGAIGESQPIVKYQRLVGGKGANQAEAARRAGAKVRFMGKVGCDGEWILGQLHDYGFPVEEIVTDPSQYTGHVIINRYEDGPPSVMLYYAGANAYITPTEMQSFLEAAVPGDILLVQNEIGGMRELLQLATKLGLRVCFNPSPAIHDDWKCEEYQCEWLILNEHEFKHICNLYNIQSSIKEDQMRELKNKLLCNHLICSFGANGVVGLDRGDQVYSVSAPKVTVVDTVGAGDCLAGYFAAWIAKEKSFPESLEVATKAASLKVTRYGAFNGIPFEQDVLLFNN